jgi:hypothetical protein
MRPGHEDETLDRLVSAARARGWRDAVKAEYGGALDLYASDPREGDCLLLLPPLGAAHRALFLGNALGTLPFLLAERFDAVVVADDKPRRLAFARERQRQDDVANVTCVAADFVEEVVRREGPFDLVVLGEECPDARTSIPFSDFRTVDHLAELVAAGGCLLYGVHGRRSHAARASLITPWRGVPASFPAHVRHLRRRFATVAVYLRSPARRPYHVYAPLDGSGAFRYWIERLPAPTGVRAQLLRRGLDVASRVGGLGAVIDSFVLVAQRS